MGVKVATRGNPVEPVHLNNLMVGLRGWGVQSGLAVAEKAAGANMSVDVAIGVAVVNLTVVTKSAPTNVAISAAHATYDRYDLVVMNSSGTVSVQAGTAAATTYASDYDLVANNAILLAEVYVPATDTTIEDAQITDFRNILQSLSDLTSGHDHDGIDSKGITNTGTYTGNGGTGDRAITGIGFQPKFLIPIQQFNGTTDWMKSDQMGANSKQIAVAGNYALNEIDSLDSDGFTVDKAGNLNANGRVYGWVAIS